MKKHIAILGGAFNPITVGHIETANFVLNNLVDIDEVWISPTYKHIFDKDTVSPRDRIKMCELAIVGYKRIKLFTYEITNKLKDGTLNFIELLEKDKAFKDYCFFLIIGMDNANEIFKWKNWERLIRVGKFIVINRPGIERDMSQNWYLNYPHIYLNKKQNNLVEVSSTKVRTLINQYHTIKDTNEKTIIWLELKKFLAWKVLLYAIKNKLYEKTERILHEEISGART